MRSGLNFFKMSLRIKQKDICLVPFPFSDFSKNKVRPVLILSNDDYNKSSQDVIICAITRNVLSKLGILINNLDLVEGNILSNSAVKVENICFIDKSLVIKKIAVLNDKKFDEVRKELFSLF